MSYEPKTKLSSANMAGNLHSVRDYCNKFGLSDFLVGTDGDGRNTVMLFRVPLWWVCDAYGPRPAKEQQEKTA